MAQTSDDTKEKAIFHAARDIRDQAQRDVYLAAACVGDLDLRKRVASLIAAAVDAEDFLESPLLDSQATVAAGEPLQAAGTAIGPYKLLEQIGEGGFGAVYMADQLKPIQRRVALKIIKAGMDTKQVIARFEAERQALAMMDHPNIAKVLDAGTTNTGRPYFVMELVRGIPVTEYCDDRNLATHDRLTIFTEICSAVQHAHQKGIIHRDLKPSNILVSTNADRPVPKVIDFGIAKATQGRLTDKTLFTQFRQFIGTPIYMSPEQAQMSAVDVDTRSDIYSLGVLLYELLTGTTPLDSKELLSAGFEEVCRRIREEEPPKPSTRLNSLAVKQRTTVAKHRRTDPQRLGHLIRGEIDWIVIKAMDKDRSRRYDSAGALAEDIACHLRGEPVSAVPPSSVYRLRKLARRHRATLATMGIIAATLVAGTIVAGWQAYIASAEREQSDRSRNAAIVARNEAVDAKETANQLALRAEVGEQQARQIAYATDMNLAAQALKRNNMRLARQLLARNQPARGETDLRNWEWRALWQHCQGDALTTIGDSEYVVWSASLSANDKWLATGSLKGEIRVWDIEDGKLVATLSPAIASGRELGRVAFSPQGDRLFATTQGGVVKVWNVPDWTLTDLRFSHGDRVRSISLSQDGKVLAVFGFDKTVTVWPVDSSADVKRVHVGSGGGIQTGAVAISPDNRWLAVGLNEGSISMYDLPTLTRQFSFPTTVASEIIKTLAFSPDSQVLASGTGFADGTVDLWSVPQQDLIRRLRGHTDYLCSLAFSPDGKLLASASADQTIRLWDTGQWQKSRILRGHQHEVWAVCFTSDGRKLVSGGKDGAICTWNTVTQSEPSWPITLPSQVPWGFAGLDAKRRVSFSPDSLWLATRNEDGVICLRTTENLTETHRFPELGTNHVGLLFAPDERLLFVGGNDGSLTWCDPLQPRSRRSQMLQPSAAIYPVNFAGGGKKLLVLAEETTEAEQNGQPGDPKTRCILWSVEDEQQIGSWEVPIDQECAALSPDGSVVVTGHYDGTLRFWQSEDPAAPFVLHLRDHVRGLAFSPTGEVLVTVNEYGKIEIWDMATRTSQGTLHGNMKAVFDVTFSPDGQRLATAGSAGESVKLWDLATRQEVATLVAPGYSFGQVAFSPDGNAILVLNIDGDVFMWRVPSKQEIALRESENPRSLESISNGGHVSREFWDKMRRAMALTFFDRHLM